MKSFYPCLLPYSKFSTISHLSSEKTGPVDVLEFYIAELLNMDIEYNRGCKYSNNSTKFKCNSASDTFITPRDIDLLVNDKMEGVRIIVISTVFSA